MLPAHTFARMLRPAEPLLIVCYVFPPNDGIGGRRWAKFSKALARRGHPVHVIHSAGNKGRERSLWTEDIEHANIHVHPLPQRYPTVLFKRPLDRFLEKVMYRVWMRLLPLMVKGNYFDRAVLWEKQLVNKAGELIAAHGILNVVVSGAPFMLMAHATRLKVMHPEINLIADFRDPWTWGHVYGRASMGHVRHTHEVALEATVARTFDKLISPAPAIIEHLRATYGGDPARYVHIPHAVDPDDFAQEERGSNDGVFRMIYAGSLYGAEEAKAYFDGVLDVFGTLRRDHPAVFERTLLDLYITADDISSYRSKVDAHGLGARIHFHPPVAPRTVFQRIASSDLVLIFIPGINKDFLGTKFNEIFSLRRPIFHVGEPGAISRHLLQHRLGTTSILARFRTALIDLLTGKTVLDHNANYPVDDLMLDSVTEKLIADVFDAPHVPDAVRQHPVGI